VGLFALCFTGEDAAGRVSQPSCVVVESGNGSTPARRPEEGSTFSLPSPFLSDVVQVPYTLNPEP